MSNGTEHAAVLKYNFISEQFTKYMGIFVYLFCLFGTVMNMSIFIQRRYNSRACTLYLLVASAFDLVHLNLGPLQNILQYGFHYDWTINFIIFCKLRSYSAFVFAIMSATLTTIASIDRYILSSRNSKRWKYCTRPIAIRCIQLTILFWFIVSIPIAFCYTRINHSSHNVQFSCSNPSRDIICFITQLLYICIFNGFFHPLIMMFFGFLTCANFHRLRQRSSLKSLQIKHINYQLTSMLILQTIKSSFSSLPFAIFNSYRLITRNTQKSLLNEVKENLFHQIFYLLFWSNYTSFFVYLYSSDIFRRQCVKTIKRIIYYICGKKQQRQSFESELIRLTTVPNNL